MLIGVAIVALTSVFFVFYFIRDKEIQLEKLSSQMSTHVEQQPAVHKQNSESVFTGVDAAQKSKIAHRYLARKSGIDIVSGPISKNGPALQHIVFRNHAGEWTQGPNAIENWLVEPMRVAAHAVDNPSTSEYSVVRIRTAGTVQGPLKKSAAAYPMTSKMVN